MNSTYEDRLLAFIDDELDNRSRERATRRRAKRLLAAAVALSAVVGMTAIWRSSHPDRLVTTRTEPAQPADPRNGIIIKPAPQGAARPLARFSYVTVDGLITGGGASWIDDAGTSLPLRNGIKALLIWTDADPRPHPHPTPPGCAQRVAVPRSRSRPTVVRLDPGCATPARCPSTGYPFERPPLPHESGDGLPPVGAATRAAAMEAEPVIQRDYRTTNTQIIELRGRAWRRRADGDVEIVPETLSVVQVIVANRSSCPDGPAFFNGVPVLFRFAD